MMSEEASERTSLLEGVNVQDPPPVEQVPVVEAHSPHQYHLQRVLVSVVVGVGGAMGALYAGVPWAGVALIGVFGFGGTQITTHLPFMKQCFETVEPNTGAGLDGGSIAHL